MTFDDWMRARNPKHCPTDDTVALRELRDCWRTAEHHSARAQEREQMIELMRDKCRKVGAGGTATDGHCTLGEDLCNCGGDVPAVRAGCANWKRHNAEIRGGEAVPLD